MQRAVLAGKHIHNQETQSAAEQAQLVSSLKQTESGTRPLLRSVYQNQIAKTSKGACIISSMVYQRR